MSRSFKKTPGFTDQQSTHGVRTTKRHANKVARKYRSLQNGSWFKKVFCPWNICDYKFLYHLGAVDDNQYHNWDGAITYKDWIK